MAFGNWLYLQKHEYRAIDDSNMEHMSGVWYIRAWCKYGKIILHNAILLLEYQVYIITIACNWLPFSVLMWAAHRRGR